MGDPEIFALYDEEELDAIQWDSLAEEMDRSVEFDVVADEAELTDIYNAARRA
jgi:spermidine/putrescine transport system substrate-binding protein